MSVLLTPVSPCSPEDAVVQAECAEQVEYAHHACQAQHSGMLHLQAVYAAQHDTYPLRAALHLDEDDGQRVSLGAFSEQIKAGFPGFEALHDVAGGK